jgi:hypothetical protein
MYLNIYIKRHAIGNPKAQAIHSDYSLFLSLSLSGIVNADIISHFLL